MLSDLTLAVISTALPVQRFPCDQAQLQESVQENEEAKDSKPGDLEVPAELTVQSCPEHDEDAP